MEATHEYRIGLRFFSSGRIFDADDTNLMLDAIDGLRMASVPVWMQDIGDVESGPRMDVGPTMLEMVEMIDFSSITEVNHPDRFCEPYSLIRAEAGAGGAWGAS